MPMNERGKGTDTAEESIGLYEALVRYSDSDNYPYHMPGHKRNKEAGAMAQYFGIDITEIDGFDNLHHAEGILREAQRRANRLYGNEGTETFYLVNGSTVGVLASVLAVTGKGDEILISRNCHKSVYHAAILQELRLRYYYPPVLEEYGICDGVDAEEIGRLLEEYPDCRAVVITSPTYEGIISDVRSVAEAVHAHDKILIVDEAHGAHLGLHETAPPGAIAGGADLVIHSLHKTLPSMTQTALLHVQGERVDRGKLARYLSMLQTSSPSYVLMASMDSCVRYLQAKGAERYVYMQEQYDIFCRKIAKCRSIRIGNMACRTDLEDTAHKKYHMTGWDVGKMVIRARNNVPNGQELYALLRKDYHLQMEMAAENYVLAMMTVMDTQEGWQRLADALCRIDDRIEEGEFARGRRETVRQKEAGREYDKGQQDKRPDKDQWGRRCGPERTDTIDKAVREKAPVDTDKTEVPERCGGMSASGAYLGKREETLPEESVGRLAADFINLYPPGIPLVVPGERICAETVEQIRRSMQMGLQVQGVTPAGKIAVVFEIL